LLIYLQAEQLLCWNVMTDTEHTKSGSTLSRYNFNQQTAK